MNRILLIGVLWLLSGTAGAALCATVDPSNALIVTTTPIGECASLIILEASDWVGSSIWSLPTPEEIAQAWAAGFTLPVTCFLVAWAAGVIVRFFSER